MMVVGDGQKITIIGDEFRLDLSTQDAYEIHAILAKYVECKGCACYESGYMDAQENVGEWNKPGGE